MKDLFLEKITEICTNSVDFIPKLRSINVHANYLISKTEEQLKNKVNYTIFSKELNENITVGLNENILSIACTGSRKEKYISESIIDNLYRSEYVFSVGEDNKATFNHFKLSLLTFQPKLNSELLGDGVKIQDSETKPEIVWDVVPMMDLEYLVTVLRSGGIGETFDLATKRLDTFLKMVDQLFAQIKVPKMN